MFAIPIMHNGTKYIITDKKTILYNIDLFFYMGVIFIDGNRYKKYINGDRKVFLVEF